MWLKRKIVSFFFLLLLKTIWKIVMLSIEFYEKLLQIALYELTAFFRNICYKLIKAKKKKIKFNPKI